MTSTPDQSAAGMPLPSTCHLRHLPSAVLHRRLHRHSPRRPQKRLEQQEEAVQSRDTRADQNCQTERLKL
jgi:hypothetical protein